MVRDSSVARGTRALCRRGESSDWRQLGQGVIAILAAAQQLADGLHVLAEIDEYLGRQRPRTPEDRPPGKTKDDPQHAKCKRITLSGQAPNMRHSEPSVAGGSIGGPPGPLSRNTTRRAAAHRFDQLAGQLAMLVIHQRQVEQKRAVGHGDQLAVVGRGPLASDDRLAVAREQRLLPIEPEPVATTVRYRSLPASIPSHQGPDKLAARARVLRMDLKPVARQVFARRASPECGLDFRLLLALAIFGPLVRGNQRGHCPPIGRRGVERAAHVDERFARDASRANRRTTGRARARARRNRRETIRSHRPIPCPN